jgi:RNA polymerase sigma-32 factor
LDSLQSGELTAAQERALVLQAQQGSQDAMKALVAANFKHVKSIVARYGAKNSAIEAEDLVSEGLVGLVRAVPKFDPGVGTRFITYAAFWIRAHVMNFMTYNRSAVYGGGAVRSKNFFAMRREASKMVGGGASYDDVVDAMQRKFGIKNRAVAETELVRIFSKDVRLDEPGDTGATMLDTLRGPYDPEQLAGQHEREQNLRKVLLKLRPRDRSIIEKTFLHSESTLADVARGMGVSRERVRQLQNRALRRLKDELQHLN